MPSITSLFSKYLIWVSFLCLSLTIQLDFQRGSLTTMKRTPLWLIYLTKLGTWRLARESALPYGPMLFCQTLVPSINTEEYFSSVYATADAAVVLKSITLMISWLASMMMMSPIQGCEHSKNLKISTKERSSMEQGTFREWFRHWSYALCFRLVCRLCI